MIRLLAPLMLLAVAACVQSRPAQTVAPPATPVAIGQHARAGPFVITPLSVYEDSRCPSGVRCIFAGRLTVIARVDGARLHQVHALTLGVPLRVGGTSLTLTNASPQRFAEISPRAQDYRFVFAAGAND